MACTPCLLPSQTSCTVVLSAGVIPFIMPRINLFLFVMSHRAKHSWWWGRWWWGRSLFDLLLRKPVDTTSKLRCGFGTTPRPMQWASLVCLRAVQLVHPSVLGVWFTDTLASLDCRWVSADQSVSFPSRRGKVDRGRRLTETKRIRVHTGIPQGRAGPKTKRHQFSDARGRSTCSRWHTSRHGLSRPHKPAALNRTEQAKSFSFEILPHSEGLRSASLPPPRLTWRGSGKATEFTGGCTRRRHLLASDVPFENVFLSGGDFDPGGLGMDTWPGALAWLLPFCAQTNWTAKGSTTLYTTSS